MLQRRQPQMQTYGDAIRCNCLSKPLLYIVKRILTYKPGSHINAHNLAPEVHYVIIVRKHLEESAEVTGKSRFMELWCSLHRYVQILHKHTVQVHLNLRRYYYPGFPIFQIRTYFGVLVQCTSLCSPQ